MTVMCMGVILQRHEANPSLEPNQRSIVERLPTSMGQHLCSKPHDGVKRARCAPQRNATSAPN
jgi:hypothetical protein